ncbi:MAG: phage tail protein [Lactococcus lactis]|nr:phage tail protein [Lactobacillus sp.]MDN6076315.1 phage tail protein [Lactococcus lactis]MDN6078487.1 phage tail protein [Lactococcus lactis]MDN6094514.1 phage tail protein [Lactococcus lactis]
MTIVGLKKSYLGLIDKATGKILTGEKGLTTDGLYMSNPKDLGTASANITNIAAAGTQKFGDNGLVDVVSSKSFPQVAVVWNNLPFAIKAKIKGGESDGKGGYVQSQDLPQVALIIESESIDRSHSIFYAFGNGQVTETALNIQTDNAAQNRVEDTLTYQSMAFEAWNNQGMKIFNGADTGFDKTAMLKEVMGGYTASAPSGGSGSGTSGQ